MFFEIQRTSALIWSKWKINRGYFSVIPPKEFTESHPAHTRGVVKLKRAHKGLLYLTSALLWITGAVWIAVEYGTTNRNENFWLPVSTVQPMSLKIHGAAAMIFMIILGTLLIDHVRLGYQQKRQRPSGLMLLTLSGLLIVSAWGLYYLGNEEWRHWTSITHCVLGLISPIIIFIHVAFARRRLRAKKTQI
jgi:hypothetical protein